MPDKYANFAELTEAEAEDAYRVIACDRRSPLLIAAPHAGGIERGTGELALAVASDDLSFYLFEGLLKTDNRRLHIRSENFDEPSCRPLLKSARMAATIHGAEGEDQITYIGGRHEEAKQAVRDALDTAGFRHGAHSNLKGEACSNICNIGQLGAGVQLELTRTLRESFFPDWPNRKRRNDRFDAFVNAVRSALLRLVI